MIEKAIEKTLKTHTEKQGGLCLKLHPDSMAGLPDRLILLPNGKHCFVELKQAGQKPRRLQVRRHQQLAALGHHVRTLDNTHDIPGLLHEIQTT